MNDFQIIEHEKSPSDLMSVEQKRAMAEVQAAVFMAKQYPRNTITATERIKNACTRPTLAEGALYEYARGGTAISGPSIRLAEVIAQNWGNLTCGIVELSRRNGESDCLAYAWDLETNFRDEKRFTVRHLRDTKRGPKKVEAERDIYEVMANMGARRKRACILAVIPGDVSEAAVEQINATLKAKAEVTPERIKSLVEKFSEFKVTKEQIEKRIQKRIDAISPAQLLNLGKIYNSLKDGMSIASEWFEVVEEKEGQGDKSASDLADKLKGKKEKKPKEDPFASEVNNYRGPLSDDTVDGVLLTFGEADNPLGVKEEFRQDVLKELKRLVDTK